MTKVAKPEDKIVFGLAPSDQHGSMLILGVTDKAWEFMADGHTHTLDLSEYGFPVKVIMFGCRTQQEAYKFVEAHNQRHQLPSLRLGQDVGIKDGSGRGTKDLKNTVFK